MNIYLIIVIVFFLIILITIIIWIIMLKQPPSLKNLSKITYSKSSYGMRCTLDNEETTDSNIPENYIPQHCGLGLSCIVYGTEKFCKVSIGYPCNNLQECTPLASRCDSVCIY